MVPTLGAPLSLPRDAWASHPHFPHQTLLLGSHEAFRTTSRTLVDRARRGGDTAALRWVFLRWKAAMGNHEHYEEGKLYPYLEARWGLDLDPARAGHTAVAEAEEAVLRAATVDGPATEALARALADHDAVLLTHLDLEEAVVIPALLALSPAEFEAYTSSSLRRLLADLGEPTSGP